ncbi:hypothetical protein ACFV5N_17800 [Streptomyces sp. NPDC059853]|uniref:hypothetical protein n=1 Tax=Streptomyces sp. NPDC059853 TaxID=3346973 RepID=UPI00365203E4
MELIDAENMEIIEAVLLPEPGPPESMGIGIVDGYPPSDDTEHADGGAYWELRETVGEATIAGRESANLLMGIVANGQAAMEGAAISYEHEGNSYRVETKNRLRVRARCGGVD